jgi:hypothetical protein
MPFKLGHACPSFILFAEKAAYIPRMVCVLRARSSHYLSTMSILFVAPLEFTKATNMSVKIAVGLIFMLEILP